MQGVHFDLPTMSSDTVHGLLLPKEYPVPESQPVFTMIVTVACSSLCDTIPSYTIFELL